MAAFDIYCNIVFEEPHKAHTLLTPEAPFYSVNNTHA